jgi:hypothetical protein
MMQTAEHVRDCQRCYEILAERAGKSLEEKNAKSWGDLAVLAAPSLVRLEFSIELKSHILERTTLMPSELWPLLAELYPAFVRCERWSNIDSP